GGFSAAHAVLWENGVPNDLGNLGGVAWNTPMAMNQAGDVVGFANIPIDPPGRFFAHAFLWTKEGGMKDLGTLPGDAKSQALGVNARRQVVGLSCGGGKCRAFVWQAGVMTDLNTLVGSAPHEPLFAAGDVNELGVITGQTLTDTGTSSAFVAVPAR